MSQPALHCGNHLRVSSADIPVTSPIASLPGFHIASGCSGHGSGIGPAMGQLMAGLIMGERPIVDPAPLSIDQLRPKHA